MKLTAMAEKLDVSTMTIYRRIKKAGLNIADLRDESGELTPAGVAAIGSLFDVTEATADVTGISHDDATSTQQGIDGDMSQGTAAQVAALTATVDGLRALVAQLEGERDELRRQVATITAALQAEQADRQQERLLLTAGTAHREAAQGDGGHDQQGRGWLARLFHRGNP